jgi:thiol-disulfide isomerase/thioredoxin
LKAFTKRVLASAALLGALALSGCAAANNNLSQQFKNGDNKNYIQGDGTVSEWAKASRKSAVQWKGVSESGDVLSSASLSGVVTVLNFWYAGCAPCRAEAPDLIDLSKQFPGVQFVGVNVRDTASTALAFDRNFGMTYPSVIDNNTGAVVLAFTGVVSPQAVPTTLVIDKQGRVASRILGRIEKGTLKALIETVVAEK